MLTQQVTMSTHWQAEFNMSLPEMGLLQSAALIGYLLGQVFYAELKTMNAAAHTFAMSFIYCYFSNNHA